jgi:hydroxymethylpyrimidine/phosphomethylpyrimidine kinase
MQITPHILVIGGHDPSGGAGIQADIETGAALGCRVFSLVTCLTSQNTQNVYAVSPQSVDALADQFDRLINDIQIDALKVGLLGDLAIAQWLAPRLADLKRPVTLDPVLRAGGGESLSNQALIDQLKTDWLPWLTSLTPNRAEARALSACNDMSEAGKALVNEGTQHVLITGADEADDDMVHNTLFTREQHQPYEWPRLPHTYHGSGCTLATALTCELAKTGDILAAAQQAQAFVWGTLSRGEQLSDGQHLPNRRLS